MRKALIKLAVFGLIIIAIDVISFYPFSYLQQHAIGGTTGRADYIYKKVNADIIILGSSRARHHYDPKLFEDSMKMSCYNAGMDGNGIILMYGRYKMITRRYTPKLIVYDVHQLFDLLPDDNTKYLTYLRPYSQDKSIDSIILSVNPNEKFKMLSNLYKNNSKVFELAGDFRAKDTNCYNGYFPINGLMKHNPAAEDAPDVYTYDNQKLYYLNRLIKDCKGKSKLVFCESPRYLAADSTVFKPIINLCAKNNILFLNHYNDKEFTGDRKLFYDSGHLNKKGSILYTKKIIKEIRNYYKF